jgi:hypothetical protein
MVISASASRRCLFFFGLEKYIPTTGYTEDRRYARVRVNAKA